LAFIASEHRAILIALKTNEQRRLEFLLNDIRNIDVCDPMAFAAW
jgi:hypothetical protein